MGRVSLCYSIRPATMMCFPEVGSVDDKTPALLPSPTARRTADCAASLEARLAWSIAAVV